MKNGRRNFLKGLLGASFISVAPKITARELPVKSRYITKSQMIKIMLSSVPITYKIRSSAMDVLPTTTIRDKISWEKDFEKLTRNELIVHAKECYGITF